MGDDEKRRPERRFNDALMLTRLSDLTSIVHDMRERQEKAYAISVALQEHKTIERVDTMWETMAEWRSSYVTLKTVGRTVGRLFTWGCATILVVTGLVIGLVEWKLAHP